MAGEIDLEWEGLQPIMAVLHNISPNVTGFLVSSETSLAIDIFNLSQKQVPVDTGHLRSTGAVSDPDITQGSVEVTIGYSAPYALFVHEDLQAHHKPPTKAKYLEDPFNTVMGNLESRLQDRVEGAIVGQYPQQVSIAQGADTAATVKRYRRNPSPSRPGMNRNEIDQALKDIRSGTKGWQAGADSDTEGDASWYTQHRERSAAVRRERDARLRRRRNPT
jgi:hypothetical protein